MCVIILIGGLILLLLVIFVKTALILLPWTLSAGAVGGLSGIGLGKLLGRSRKTRAIIGAVSTLFLTMAFGYLFCLMIPPKAPPPKEGLEILLEAPEPKREDLDQMLPIHLGIVSIIGALVVSQFWWQRSPAEVASLPQQKPTGE